ncbi:metal-dependent hydrolase [Erysipelothrix sp. HDW6C]|uniref:metal-dependent hydrolase n=1 Tax=Erysipelothrix sp. HDW6C TaxID=2714930 RepID=UPI00140E5531|nr:metal-dependent hydrolase [Erysipelothrix sp. HDW6C]QIK69149.1 metal-dependent hydrolase [Erysipelothrix sp. HDW6C]
MKFSWHGHSCIYLEAMNGCRIIIDPFIIGNELSDLDPESLDVDYIILTHGHADHVGDTLEIAKRTGATVIAVAELAEFMEKRGAKAHGMNIGGRFEFDFGSVKFVHAQHSSSYDGFYMGEPAGIVVDDGYATIYHAGDTALYSDMSLIGSVDVAFLPIGDNYTMGIDDALKAAQRVPSELYVPIHYNTFPVIEQNPYEFVNRLDGENGLVPEIGDLIEI